MDTPLTPRQERFVLEYLKDQHASAAAARAGYTAKNMAAQGHELLNNPAIRERVREAMEAMLAEIRTSALVLMKRRMRGAFFDAGKLFKGGWELRPLEELDAETRAALEVTCVTRKSGPVVTMKQPDRDRALRGLERVYERLDRLNEKHYAALEKAGKVPTLAELAAREEEGPAQIAEKCMVLSGGVTAPGLRISEKGMVLSGCEPTPGFSPRGACPALGTFLRSSTGSERTDVGREIPEKHMVLSGSRWRPPPLVAAMRWVTQALGVA